MSYDLKRSFHKKSNRTFIKLVVLRRSCGSHFAALRVGSTAPKKRRSGGEPSAALFDLIDPGCEPQTYRTDDNMSTTGASGRLYHFYFSSCYTIRLEWLISNRTKRFSHTPTPVLVRPTLEFLLCPQYLVSPIAIGERPVLRRVVRWWV